MSGIPLDDLERQANGERKCLQRYVSELKARIHEAVDLEGNMRRHLVLTARLSGGDSYDRL
jgi:hypothetical protein